MNRIVTLLQTPDRLVLSAVDAQGRAYEFQFVEFRYGGIGGGMGDYVVPLHSKATYSLKLSLDDFWLRDMTSSATQLLPGKSRITVHLRSQPRGLQSPSTPSRSGYYLWVDDLVSNTLELER